MAEASLSMQLKANNHKKRKTDTGQIAKNKKALSNSTTSDDNVQTWSEWQSTKITTKSIGRTTIWEGTTI